MTMPRIDITAATDPHELANSILGVFASPQPTAISEPADEPGISSEGMDLHAYTHCPSCNAIKHRVGKCANCGYQVD